MDQPRRWGRQRGEVVLGGWRVRLDKPRVRQAGREVANPTYVKAQRDEPLSDRALERMLVGIGTRQYRRSLEILGALKESGASKSAMSRRIVAAAAKRSAALPSRPLRAVQEVAAMLDGLGFGAHMILVALGIDAKGRKHLLGLRGS